MKLRKLKLSGMMLAGIIIIVTFVYAVNIQPVVIGDSGWFSTYAGLNTFESYDDFVEFLSSHTWNYYDVYCDSGLPMGVLRKSIGINTLGESDSSGDIKNVDYSKTNIQVEGVDEPDIVKTDGKYLFILANSKIYVVKANPAENATILSIISFEDNTYISNFFINKNCLIVFGTSQRYPIEYEENKEWDEQYSYWWGVSTTVINIFDISDRENPVIVKDIEVDGAYYDARMIGDIVYIIATENPGIIYRVLDGNTSINIPEITINECTTKIPVDQIYYINNSEKIDVMTHIISIDIFGDEIVQKSFLLGSSQTMYVSNNNIFLACYQYRYYSSFFESVSQYEDSTVIHKISINNGEISYVSKGEVPGQTLNQFSMDEHNGYFRIATQRWTSESGSITNLYILDEDMNRTSEIEEIAPGERMYSARFMGDKAFLVTFKKVDPFFTLDLSDPYNAKILGKLKIPGYSDYLHPFDENHIIGFGKDTVESEYGDFAWYQGLKIALFDVTDFENPKEVAKVVIGDRGTDSSALFNHKAFLFDREKELLVLPVNLCEISDEIKEQKNGYTGCWYGEPTFHGTFVYKLSLENGFEYRGRISSSYDPRSLYIDDILYTISNNDVKMNSLGDLSEINSIQLK